MTRRDLHGRRYFEVPPFEDGPIKAALAAQPDRCVVCGMVIVHGTDRYYQRSASLVYDPVCGPCGDQALAAMATN